MNIALLRALTWTTVASAIASALLLAATGPELPLAGRGDMRSRALRAPALPAGASTPAERPQRGPQARGTVEAGAPVA